MNREPKRARREQARRCQEREGEEREGEEGEGVRIFDKDDGEAERKGKPIPKESGDDLARQTRRRMGRRRTATTVETMFSLKAPYPHAASTRSIHKVRMAIGP